MKIAFFSTWHGRGTTTNAIVTAVNLALNYEVKVLLTHSQYTRSNLEDAFLGERQKNNMLDFNDTGIDSIERLVKSRLLKAEDFPDYTMSFIEDRLDLLVGSQKSNVNLFSKDINDTVLDILNKSDEHYDFTIIDVNSGFTNTVTKKIIDNSDLVVCCLDQNEKIIKDFFEKDIKKLNEEKLLVVLGRYDENVKCSARYVENNFNWKDGTIYKVCYSPKLMDNVNNHSILKFFYGCDRKENEFFKNLNVLSERIVDFKQENVVRSELERQSVFNLKSLKKLIGFR